MVWLLEFIIDTYEKWKNLIFSLFCRIPKHLIAVGNVNQSFYMALLNVLLGLED
jgi:hypothetical protein